MRFICIFLLGLICALPARAQTAPQDVVVVFDMSGSMWGQVNGQTKADIAREAFEGLTRDWAQQGMRAGLIAYGHRRKGDCSDIELLARPEDKADLGKLIAGLSPRGKAPLSAAVRKAADTLRFTEEKATVILLSDGLETCNADPCALGAELEQLGVDFTAHVIGFSIAEKDRAQLQCLADETGGSYFDAQDASGLNDALEQVADATAQAEPEVERAPAMQTVRLRFSLPEGRDGPDDLVVTVNGKDPIAVESGQMFAGIELQLPAGAVTIQAKAGTMSGEISTSVAPDTRSLTVPLKTQKANYRLWTAGPFPVDGRKQILLLRTDTGAPLVNHFYGHLYQKGQTAPEDVLLKTSPIARTIGQWNKTTIEPAPVAGTYDLILRGFHGTELGSIDITFAEDIAPEWLGERQVAPGALMEARWVGDHYRTTNLAIRKGGKNVVSKRVESMVDPERGLFIKVPIKPDLYELVLSWIDGDNQRHQASLGPLAVGVDLPDEQNTSVPPASPPSPTPKSKPRKNEAAPDPSGATSTAGTTVLAQDERGAAVAGPVFFKVWNNGTQQEWEAVSNSPEHSFETLPAGNYRANVRTGDGMVGRRDFSITDDGQRSVLVHVRPEGEGADLPVQPAYFCSEGEDCRMRSSDIPVSFTLPDGWAAEQPEFMGRPGYPTDEIAFNMVTMTANGPFWVTLNQRQRMAALGPCETIVWGTFCHDHTDDPDLLADVALIRDSMRTRATSRTLEAGDIEAIERALAGK